MLRNNITRMRKERGLTQVELAKALHVTQSAVSHWESGRSLPDTVQLFQIAEFFGVSIDTIKSDSASPQASVKNAEDHQQTHEEDKKPPADARADKGAELFAKLNDENKAQVLQYMEFLMHKQ